MLFHVASCIGSANLVDQFDVAIPSPVFLASLIRVTPRSMEITPAQFGLDSPKYTGVADGTSADHQSRCVRHFQATGGALCIDDVTVGDDRNLIGLSDLDHLTNHIPIGNSAIFLSQGSPVNTDSQHTELSATLCNFKNSDSVLTRPQSHLH